VSKLIVNINKIIDNIKKIDLLLKPKGIKWTLVTKILSGNKKILNAILKDPVIKKLHSIGDSRLSNLKAIKSINPKIITMYIKPPVIKDAFKVIKYADISTNTSIKTIEALNKEAINQNKIHKIIIMLELGELREGVLPKNLINFYSRCINLSNIQVIGIGTNLGCMYGIKPSIDNMHKLTFYKKQLEKEFNKKLKLISGGGSINLQLTTSNASKEINHLRIGEAVFLGTNPLTGKKFKNLNTDVFKYKANIIELKKKKNKPYGKISQANIGHTSKIKNSEVETYRAIVDFGLLDVDARELKPISKNISFIGTTSDMSVFDLHKNINTKEYNKKQIGSSIKFKLSYMAVARLCHSKYTKIEVK